MGERHTCFMCTMQTTNEPLAMCDQCDEDVRKSAAQAKAAARAEGYAEGRAAERADMLAFVEEACRLGTQGDALLRALMAKGRHEGAAELSASRKLLAEAVGASEPMTIFNLIDIVKERFRPEGLRGACEAIGLVCLDKGVYDLIVATGEKHRVTAELAERVRRERCLVARAVAGGVDLDVREGVDDGKWGVHVIGRGCGAEHHADNVPAAEVPATLARMLGEVGA